MFFIFQNIVVWLFFLTYGITKHMSSLDYRRGFSTKTRHACSYVCKSVQENSKNFARDSQNVWTVVFSKRSFMNTGNVFLNPYTFLK